MNCESFTITCSSRVLVVLNSKVTSGKDKGIIWHSISDRRHALVRMVLPSSELDEDKVSLERWVPGCPTPHPPDAWSGQSLRTVNAVCV